MAKVLLTSKSSAMKSALPFLSLALVFASCSTAYKSGQTPDDVYYSPARPQEEYVRTETRETPRYRYDEEYRDDRYLRMKIRNRRWSGLYDDYYSYNPYYYHYYNGSLYYNSPWNSVSYWNHFYNPGCAPVYVINPGRTTYNRPRTFDMSVYNPQPAGMNGKTYSRNGYSSPNYRNGNANTNNYRGSGTNAGNFLRDAFSGSGSSSNNSSNRSSGTSTNSSSSGSSGSSRSSGSTNAPARRF